MRIGMLLLAFTLLLGRLVAQGFPPTQQAPTDSPSTGDIRHVTDQFAGSELWLTKQVGLAKLEKNHCDFWMTFGVEHVKQTGTEFIVVYYVSVASPFSSSKPMGIVADVTLQLALGDTVVSGVPFHPVTADKALAVKGYDSRKTDVTPFAQDYEQSFLYALPTGILERVVSGAPAKVRLQGPQRTCDAALDQRAQSAIGALLAAVGPAKQGP